MSADVNLLGRISIVVMWLATIGNLVSMWFHQRARERYESRLREVNAFYTQFTIENGRIKRDHP